VVAAESCGDAKAHALKATDKPIPASPQADLVNPFIGNLA
jgi:hypothetical protein